MRGSKGEFYLAGMFGGSSSASPEAVLFKLDANGQEIGRQPWRGAYANAVAVQSNGDCYLTGYVQDPDQLGVGQKYDFYLAKHAADGTLLWERTGGTLRTEDRTYLDDGQAGNAIAIDDQGNLLVAGRSQGPAVYGAVAFPNTLGGPLLCKYAPDGTLLWAKRVEGSKHFAFGKWFGYGWADTMMFDSGGNIIIGGTMTDGRADFGGTVVTINGYFDYGAFTAKYTPTGDVIWVKTTATARAVDMQGNVFASDAHSVEAGMVNDLYKYDLSGSVVWKRTIIGPTLNLRAVDPAGNPFYCGWFTGSIDLDGHVLSNENSTTAAGFVAKANASGFFQWAITVGGKIGGVGSVVTDILWAPPGSLHVAGSISCSSVEGVEVCDGGSFGPFPLSVQMGGSSDFFLAHIADTVPVAVELKIARTLSGLAISWPASATGLLLETAESLPSTNWTSVSNNPVLDGDQNVVTLNAGKESQFFRLKNR